MKEKFRIFFIIFILILPTLSLECNSAQNEITVEPPPARTIDPNSFPTFVFSVYNNSDELLKPDFRVSLPGDWEIISLKKPSFIEPETKERVRITCLVPKYSSADNTYILGLITEWKSYSDTSLVEITINPKSAFKLITFTEEKQVFPGQIDSIIYVIQNEGNITEAIQLEVEMPDDWELLQLIDRFSLLTHEKETINLKFKVPKFARDGSRETIRLRANSLNTDKVEIKTINIAVTEIIERKVQRSLHPTVPINVGFAISNIKKEAYPELSVFFNTGFVDLGKYSSRIEFTEKSSSVPYDETPDFTTERIRWELLSEKWNLILGDVNIDYEPLMSAATPLSRAGFESLRKSGRGVRFKYMFKKSYLSFLYAKERNSDKIFFSAIGDYLPSDKIEIASSYLRDDKTNLLELRGIYNSQRNYSFEALCGVSKSDGSKESLQFGGEIGANSRWKSLNLSGRIYGANNSYAGSDAGKRGAQLNTGWEPLSFLYLWNRINAYNNVFSSISDSSVFVTDLRSRALFYFGKLPSFNFGINYRRDKYSDGYKYEEKKFDFRIQKSFKFGTPSLYYLTERYEKPDSETAESKTELSAGWISYFKSSRLSLKHKFLRNNSSPWGYESSMDFSHRFLGIQLGLFGTYGKEWKETVQNEFTDIRKFDLGLRSDFGIDIFGINFSVRSEIGKELIGDEGWNFSVSFSAGTARRFQFDLPVPIIKTKGQLVGAIFIDKNENSIRDVDEQGIPQILILLENEDAITDEDGRFEFSAMEPGEYSFSVNIATLPAYLALEGKIPKTVSIQKGIVNSIEIPVTSVCSISGSVYLDVNSNEKFDSAEKGISTIRLIIQNEKKQAWEIYTDRDGRFKATDLLPGIYTIKIDPAWLPNRTLPGKKEWTVILTPNEPHKTINISVVKKVLKIKKTFIAPKNIKN
ncbi:MAG: hypothetical protein H8E11_02420 [Candidatus Cloacimonetes bacterium]|nr:hypothetical protein [Candidatus Cloacimonadota bacterium]